MLKVWDYFCDECLLQWEVFIEEDEEVLCEHCGNVAKRCVATPNVGWIKMAGNKPGHFPTADDKWAKAHTTSPGRDKEF